MALAGMKATAQAGVETWQGTLHVGQDLRVVLQVRKSDGGLKGTFFSIDQGPNGTNTTTLSLDAGAMKFTLVGMDASYEGKLSADGKSAVGTWKQGGRSTPLVLEHVSAEAAWEIPKPSKAMSLMDPKLTPGYEVATVKLSDPSQQGRGFNLIGRHLVARNFTVEELITLAYNVHPRQLVGGPDWMTTEHFDLDVLPDHEGLPSFDQARGIVRQLLAERFGLKFHEEQKEMPAYVLSVAKTGIKFARSASDPSTPPGMGGPPGKCSLRNGSMAEFAQVMQGIMDRPVLNQTGLKDRYDFQLKWTPDETQYGGRLPPKNADNGTSGEDQPPPLFTAIQEQLGLKLEAMKAPVTVMAIDKVEKPSAN